jgi:ferredoxin-NADP reductase/ferredoxin/truncated hemoglobin YjbI
MKNDASNAQTTIGNTDNAMHKLKFHETTLVCRDNESVLDAALRQGVSMPFSCRNGICQVCLQRCLSGMVPEAAQQGLRPALRDSGYFLPCKCFPQGDMEIAPPRVADLFVPAVVHQKEMIAADVCRLLIEPATVLNYRAGQFVNLRRADGLTRSYSLASIPQQDYFLELQVKRMHGGVLSNWIFDTLQPGDEVEIQGPQGRGYYAAGNKDQPLLLVATGTGLAPLIGIARDALHSGHRARIHLYHGSRHPAGIYLRNTLLDLCGRHPHFHYTACVSGKETPAGFVHGRAHEVAFGLHEDLRGWRLYLAGMPQMVSTAEILALKAGVPPAEIFADPFELQDKRRQARTVKAAPAGPRSELPPDPELWQALNEGALLSEVLTDFYTRVFEDARLAPYFRAVTKQRLIEKVYSFMRAQITGERSYFGDRPRNAHHWMVISDELFDYRESLMTDCLRRHGLAQTMIERLQTIEESFRPDIVKPEAWPRIVNGIELPLDGFGDMAIEVGSLCDGCQQEIAVGTRVRYHLRLGTTYCPDCQARNPVAVRAQSG